MDRHRRCSPGPPNLQLLLSLSQIQTRLGYFGANSCTNFNSAIFAGWPPFARGQGHGWGGSPDEPIGGSSSPWRVRRTRSSSDVTLWPTDSFLRNRWCATLLRCSAQNSHSSRGGDAPTNAGCASGESKEWVSRTSLSLEPNGESALRNWRMSLDPLRRPHLDGRQCQCWFLDWVRKKLTELSTSSRWVQAVKPAGLRDFRGTASSSLTSSLLNWPHFCRR